MYVYIIAFILTLIFIRQAARYHNLYYGVSQGGLCSQSSNYSVPYIETLYEKKYTNSERKSFLFKYLLFFILSVIPLFFTAALRYDVGTDYFYTYVPNFYKIMYGEMPYSETGFNYFNKFLQLFTHNAQWLFVITGFIFSFFFVRTVIKCSVDVTISVIVLYCTCIFFWSLNNVRQAVAVILTFAAFPHLIKRHTVRYFIYIALAFIFHISALIMIVPYFMVSIKLIRERFKFFIITVAVAFPFLCGAFIQFLSLTKYSYYITDFNTGSALYDDIWLNCFHLIFAGALIYKRRMHSVYAYVLLIMQFFALMAASATVFITIPEMFLRLTRYFQIYQVLLVPYCYRKTAVSIELKRFYLLSYIVPYGIYTTTLITGGAHEVLPYRFIFAIKFKI